jgi:Cu/Ag efflux pump CusA
VQRKIVVQANVAGRDLGSTIAEGRPLVITLLSLVSVALIFLILYVEFRSVRIAGFIMANLPLALIGGIFAVVLTGGVVSIASLVGFVTLFGIATRNGILLIAHYRHLLAVGIARREAILRGSLERLSPILMTALVAGLALLPLALGGGEPGNEIQTPLAIVVLGGLLSSTALNMVVLPALYWLWGDREAPAERAEEDEHLVKAASMHASPAI